MSQQVNPISEYRMPIRLFWPVILFSFAINLLYLVLPIFSMQVFDRVLSSRNTDTLILLSAIALFLLLLQAVMDWVRAQMMLRAGLRMEHVLSAQVLRLCMQDSIKTRSSRYQPLQDLTKVRSTLISPGLFALFDAPFAPLFIGVLFLMHPWLGWFSLAGVVLLFLVTLLNLWVIKSGQIKAAASGFSLDVRARDWLQHADVVKSLGMQDPLLKQWARDNDEALLQNASTQQRVSLVLAIAKFTRMFLQIGVLTISVVLVLQNEVGAGVLIAASMVMSRALSPVEQAVNHWRSWISGWQAHTRLKAIVPSKPFEEPMRLPEPKARLQLNKIAYVIPGQKEPLLQGVSLGVNAGEVLAIIGPSGAGKSTLARLMVGLGEVVRGEIRLDGAMLDHWPVSQLGQAMGYLPQDVQLLEGSVADNISRFDNQSDHKAVILAARRAGVHELILSLPNAYDTNIGGKDGVTLSGGQMQRIGLARAMYGNPKVLVLDEPSANLDPVGDQALQRAIHFARQEGRAVVLITHRNALLMQATHVAILKDGTIAKYGPAKEVIDSLKAPQAATADDEKIQPSPSEKVEQSKGKSKGRWLS